MVQQNPKGEKAAGSPRRAQGGGGGKGEKAAGSPRWAGGEGVVGAREHMNGTQGLAAGSPSTSSMKAHAC